MSQEELIRNLSAQLTEFSGQVTTLSKEVVTFTAELPYIKSALGDLKENLTLGEGKSQLRDSVSLMIRDGIEKQEDKCMDYMRVTASDVAESKIKEHETAFHMNKKTSKPPPSNAVRIDVANLKPMIKWFIIAILGGGATFGGYQFGQNNTTQPAAKTAPAEVDE